MTFQGLKDEAQFPHHGIKSLITSLILFYLSSICPVHSPFCSFCTKVHMLSPLPVIVLLDPCLIVELLKLIKILTPNVTFSLTISLNCQCRDHNFLVCNLSILQFSFLRLSFSLHWELLHFDSCMLDVWNYSEHNIIVTFKPILKFNPHKTPATKSMHLYQDYSTLAFNRIQ